MKATRVRVLVALAALGAAIGWLLADAAYAELPPLPRYAPLSMVVLAVVEAAFAKIVRDRLGRRRDERGRPRGRPLHPMQVARAAVLAKATSPVAALIMGGYAGLFGWTWLNRVGAPRVADDALIAGASAVAAFVLTVTALLLERACRTPDPPD
ncbi:MAG TPA: DUF3180 domain-containing protein [Mycobacteriales bacterium]|nr:DUF3180 domain-containing protein [Mycobacteriales bacterium]